MGYKNKKFRRIQPLTAFMIILAAALAVFMIGIGINRFMGAQNTTVILSNGEELKYVGMVDASGRPISGTLYYRNGMSAKIDLEAGSVTYSDGTVYYGSLDADYRRSGTGRLEMTNGDSYTGEFEADRLTGKGIYSFASGDIYEGDFVDGVKDGAGKYTASDGSIYEGEFKNDMRHGKGKHISAEGDIYEGDFVNDVKSGEGRCEYANGDIYEGGFYGDLRHGDGRYVWANGETYTGEFKNGNMNGFGTYTWPTGRASYTGYFEDGLIVVIEQ